jgi:membrane-associated phospholipid phosphatase
MAMLGWLIFYFFPTETARPRLPSAPWIYRVLVSIDLPTNGFPCLHSSFSILAGTALAIENRVLASVAGRLALLAWISAITISVIALRQHTGADVVAGSIIGFAVAWAYALRAPGRTRT